MSISWDEYFMGIASLSAKRSKDPKTQVGACIIDGESKKILSIGYNGLPRGIEDDKIFWDDKTKHMYVCHAEANAILNSNNSLKGSILYVTMFPCNECAKLIIQSGIKEIVYLEDKFLHKESGMVAKQMFDLVGITIRKYGGN